MILFHERFNVFTEYFNKIKYVSEVPKTIDMAKPTAPKSNPKYFFGATKKNVTIMLIMEHITATFRNKIVLLAEYIYEYKILFIVYGIGYKIITDTERAAASNALPPNNNVALTEFNSMKMEKNEVIAKTKDIDLVNNELIRSMSPSRIEIEKSRINNGAKEIEKVITKADKESDREK